MIISESQKALNSLIGEQLISATVSELKDEINFETVSGKKFRMYHEQDCCESVWVEEIIGDFSDIINSPILKAEERSEDAGIDDDDETTATWTFYEFATIKGSLTIRWIGKSNGYYSEGVDFEEIKS